MFTNKQITVLYTYNCNVIFKHLCKKIFYLVASKMRLTFLTPPTLLIYSNNKVPGKQLGRVGDCVSIWGLGKWWCS